MAGSVCGDAGGRRVFGAPAAVGAGKVTEYPLAQAESWPSRIAAGPNGTLWFTEKAAKVGRITTTGRIREFDLPASGGPATEIAAGRDGAMWFLPGTGGFGRITTKGEVRLFDSPAWNFRPSRLAAGPDGAMWFTESQCIENDIQEEVCTSPTSAASPGTARSSSIPCRIRIHSVRHCSRPGSCAVVHRVGTYRPDHDRGQGQAVRGFPGDSVSDRASLPDPTARCGSRSMGPAGDRWSGGSPLLGSSRTFPLAPAPQFGVVAPGRHRCGTRRRAWVTDPAAAKIRRITTRGKVTVYRLPANSRPGHPNAGVSRLAPTAPVWLTNCLGTGS